MQSTALVELGLQRHPTPSLFLHALRVPDEILLSVGEERDVGWRSLSTKEKKTKLKRT